MELAAFLDNVSIILEEPSPATVAQSKFWYAINAAISKRHLGKSCCYKICFLSKRQLPYELASCDHPIVSRSGD